MRTFRTLAQAEKDRDKLQDYINLIEHYQPKTLTQYVVFEYALQGNLQKVADNLNRRGIHADAEPLTPDLVKEFLMTTPQKEDELHKQVRSLYLKRTRPARRKS
ncbi:hypothetical protein MXL46_11440 [Heyndrickxia sporothermodurans]|uniref:Uncharacterized protein n=2 Tax=Siminovitchia TaxID=2837510 RepID=A0A429X9W3_SIMTE|nr:MULTISPECIES: hypothetical protein [Bacillaceae]MBM7715344.1 hypothetical protein [Siminovitchia thermophila]MEB6549700.1 hypothetical protein [Heyndrickxia sporothermodurans]RST60131.1 hypothetical protein D5F11_008715 [Siminovitchia terrae]